MVEFDQFKKESGHNYFVMTATKWINNTKSIGLKTKSGKYGGGTFAHRDIALEFATWISTEIRLYVIKEFQRLKIQETEQLEWQGNRLLTKLNHLIHTDAIKEFLVTIELTSEQKNFIYANEVDLLNVALFGKTANQWRDENPNKDGNIRDYANTIELAILSNLEYLNSILISEGVSQKDRLIRLNEEGNKQKELFNKNNVKPINRIMKK